MQHNHLIVVVANLGESLGKILYYKFHNMQGGLQFKMLNNFISI